MATMLKSSTLTTIVYAFALSMGSHTTSAPPPVPLEVRHHIERVTSCLHPGVFVSGEPYPCITLKDRMAQLHVPGVSIAVIHNGTIEWANGFGVKQEGGEPVNADTLFQAGSISKPVSAMAALHQVQQKKLSLDADVNSELVTWKVPDNPIAHGKPVTLRELLSHTSGLNGEGFPGYGAKQPVPTLLQVLNGEKPSYTGPIKLQSEPGSEWAYSGGGYTVIQQLLIDRTGEPFLKLLHETVLAPLGMTNSTFEQPLSPALQPQAALPYQADGKPVPGGAHTYPELAAAGLWSTPSDLARFAIEMQRSLDGKAHHVLSQDLASQMVTVVKGDWGLGFETGGSDTDPLFEHGGSDAGFESLMVAYRNHGDGAVVMTNGQGGGSLAMEIVESIAAEYAWPNFRHPEHTIVKVAPTVLGRYAGTYEFRPGFVMTFVLNGGQLAIKVNNQVEDPLFPESQTKFFLKSTEVQFEFFADKTGDASYVVLQQNGHDQEGLRK